jgi:hypothetical protein
MIYCAFCFDEVFHTLDIECENVQGKMVTKSLHFCEDHFPVMDAILAVPGFWEDRKEK